MNGQDFDAIQYLVQVAPVVVVMGIAIKYLWAELKDTQEKLRASEVENLKVLTNISDILDRLTESQVSDRDGIKAVIVETGESIRAHINGLVDRIESRIR